MFYRAPNQYNMDYLETSKAHLKVSEAQNGAMGYHPGLDADKILEKHNITWDTEIE